MSILSFYLYKFCCPLGGYFNTILGLALAPIFTDFCRPSGGYFNTFFGLSLAPILKIFRRTSAKIQHILKYVRGVKNDKH